MPQEKFPVLFIHAPGRGSVAAPYYVNGQTMDLIGRIITHRFKIIDKITDTGLYSVYHALDKMQDDAVVIVKFLNNERLTNRIEDIIRFRADLNIVAQIEDPGLVRIFDTGETDDRHYIATEPIECRSLRDLIESGVRISMEQTVRAVIKAAGALSAVHGQGVLHRDLTPGNILVPDDSDLSSIKLQDFGLAHLKDFSRISEPGEIAATFSYMSPERSGIIRDKVNGTSDLYSLGVIFYQLAAGQLPFRGRDVSTIIHQHIAMLPESPSEINAEVPEILSAIIMKLLEKEPGRRYQSAQGLLDDLLKFQAGETDSIILRKEQFLKLNYKTELIGREEEYGRLMSIFDRMLGGAGGLFLINGESGRGKTRLVEELLENVYYHRGTFIEGAFPPGENKTPYVAISEALDVYLRFFNEYPEARKKEIIDGMKSSLGNLGEIIMKLNPRMKEIVGDSPPLQEIRQDRELKRFLMTATQFFYNLSRAENGLVIILDHLQWMDEGSSALLTELIKGIREHPLLLIGIYRSDELGSESSLVKFLEGIRSGEYPVEEIHLPPFSATAMNMFIASLLNVPIDHITEIAAFIQQKSKGNPYFAAEIAKHLLGENALFLRDNRWMMNHSVLDQMEISSTLIDFILKKISLLSEREKELLTCASAIGRKFDLSLLFRISRLQHEEVVAIIDRAIELQLLEEDPVKKGSLVFFHDRIHEAFYHTMDTSERRVLHLEIGRAIEEMNSANVGPAIFELARHYIESADKGKILEYAYPAGLKALENFANEEALKFFLLVRYIIEEKGNRGDAQWIDTMEYISNIYLTIGENEKTIEIFNVLLKHVKARNRRAQAYKMLSQAYFTRGDWNECEEHARLGLELLGENLPVKRLPVLVGIVKELLLYVINSWDRKAMETVREKSDSARSRIIIKFFMTLSWMYILSDIFKFFRLVLRMVNISRKKLGKSKELGMSLAVFASLLMVIPFFKRADRHHRVAIRMREELNDQYGTAQSLQFMGYCSCYQGDYYRSIEYFNRARAIFGGIGDVWEIAMILNGLGYSNFYLGNYNEMISNFSQYLDISRKLNDYYGISVSKANLCMAYAQKGDFEEAEKWGMQALALSREKELWYPHCFANINYGYLKMEMGNYDEAAGYLESARKLYYGNNFLKDYTVYLFPFLAEAYLEVFKTGRSRINRAMAARACRESLRHTKKWVNHYASALRVNAKFFAFEGNHRKADAFFRASIRHSARLGRRYELARSLYEYGIYLKQKGHTEYAETRFKTANQIFKEIEPTVYVKRTSDLLGIAPEEDITSIRKLLDKQRMYSIIRVSQDISSILNLSELLEKVMSVAIEITGAQRGYLLIANEESRELEVVAKKKINETRGSADELPLEIPGEVYRSGSPLLVNNAMEDERYSKYPGVIEYGLKSILCIPIRYKDEVKGVCYLDNPLSVSVFSEDDQDVLGIIMTQVAISIEIVRLYELAITDGLTKLVTHRHFQNIVHKELVKAARQNRDLSLIMIDFDRFKELNDTFGHQSGDEVLKNISAIIKSSCRGRDIVARYGGEEVVVVLPETPLYEAGQVAERIRRTVESAETVYRSLKLKITVSLGVSSFPYPAWDRESLIQLADRALYLSKEHGRNRVTIAGRDMIAAGPVTDNVTMRPSA